MYERGKGCKRQSFHLRPTPSLTDLFCRNDSSKTPFLNEKHATFYCHCSTQNLQQEPFSKKQNVLPTPRSLIQFQRSRRLRNRQNRSFIFKDKFPQNQ